MSDEIQPKSHSPVRRITGVRVAGTGSFLPDYVVTNEDLAALGYDADWILQRSGIRARRHAPPEMATSDMAVAAAERCIAAARVPRSEIDLLLLATFTPDYLIPATACTVQERLGLNCGAMDVSAACAGFLYALITGMQFVATGCSQAALVIGADTNSRVMNPEDKKTYPLFGDGAGAVLLVRGEADQGLSAYTLGADGAGEQLLIRPAGGTRCPATAERIAAGEHFVRMEGRPVFKWAVRLVADSVRQVTSEAGLALGDVDLWLPHQANARILDAAIENLGVDPARVVVHMDRYGNTSAGSVPIALDESVAAGRVQRGDHLLLCGFGAGLAWGTALMKW
jgi:3-oxoacyl-[acyl-carrier-protein] synthase-3